MSSSAPSKRSAHRWDRRKVGGQAASTTSAHGPSPSAPISTSLKTQATYPPSVRERARKYPTAVAPPISRRSLDSAQHQIFDHIKTDFTAGDDLSDADQQILGA